MTKTFHLLLCTLLLLSSLGAAPADLFSEKAAQYQVTKALDAGLTAKHRWSPSPLGVKVAEGVALVAPDAPAVVDDDPLPQEEVLSAPNFVFWKQFVKMMLTVGLLVGALLVVAWLYRRLGLRGRSGSCDLRIHLLERRALSSKTALFLVEVGTQRFLIGDSPNGVRRIAELSKNETTLDEESGPSFMKILDKKMEQSTDAKN